MRTTSPILLGRIAMALAALAPATACAQPVDQAATPNRGSTPISAGVPASTFVSRHEKKVFAGDTNGDGKVSRAEFMATAKAGKHDPAKRFAKLDANGDGMLDTAEINAMLNRRFKHLDANGDGVLSPDERAAAHARKAPDAGDGAES